VSSRHGVEEEKDKTPPTPPELFTNRAFIHPSPLQHTMAFITRLPTETFIHVLGFLGPEFFAENISRLSVCRQWFECARHVLYANLQLKSAHSLVRFTSNPAALSQSKARTTSVELSLRPESNPNPQETEQEWASKQRASLATLASFLQDCEGLRHLQVTMTPGPETYLGEDSVLGLLDLRNLTSLVFNAAGSDSYMRIGRVSSVHLCAAVNDLILHSPALRSIHLRLDHACPCLFDTPRALPDGSLQKLEVIILNTVVYVGNMHAHTTPCNFNKDFDRPCDTKQGHRLEIEQQALKLVKRAPNLKTLRFFGESMLRNCIDAHDVIDDKWSHSPLNAPWDAEGVEFVPRIPIWSDDEDDLDSDMEEELFNDEWDGDADDQQDGDQDGAEPDNGPNEDDNEPENDEEEGEEGEDDGFGDGFGMGFGAGVAVGMLLSTAAQRVGAHATKQRVAQLLQDFAHTQGVAIEA
jgi:hypothetical protein